MPQNPPQSLGKKIKTFFRKREAFRLLRKYHSENLSIEDRTSWAMNFGGSGPFKIKTIQKPSEITALAHAVAELKPKVILEIGTAKGGTLLIWSSIATDRVITCDISDMSVQADLYKSLPPPGSSCKVELLVGDSHSVGFKKRVAETLGDQKVDFLFIDGDHTLQGVTADYNNYREFVRPGGIIAFHDILENQPLEVNQVFHLWKELKKECDTEEFVDDYDQCGYGIGIIRLAS
ncbi:MAG TPA: class I SAM-dependent methyltransferase [Gammaproteobacteria bacterium]|nr:class I SAM-dependent methyltransferase [Gammaproteobacteria bacterium]